MDFGTSCWAARWRGYINGVTGRKRRPLECCLLGDELLLQAVQIRRSYGSLASAGGYLPQSQKCNIAALFGASIFSAPIKSKSSDHDFNGCPAAQSKGGAIH